MEDRRLLSLTTPFSTSQEQALETGLANLAQWTKQLNTYGALGEQLPFVQQSIGEVARISDALQNFDNQLTALLPSNVTPQDFASVLAQVTSAVGGLAISVDPSSVTVTQDPSKPIYRFTLRLHAQDNTATSIDLNNLVNSGQVSFAGPVNVNLTGSLDFNFSFGLDLTPNLTPSQMFLFNPTSLVAQGQTTASNIHVGAQVGFLGGGIQNGQLALGGSVQVAFQPSGEMRLSDVLNSTVEDLVQLSATSSLSAQLPFQAQLGSSVINGSFNITQPDLFQGAPSVTLTGVNDFQNVSAQDMSGLVSQLGGWAQSLSDSSIFSQQIPFTSVTLGSLLDLKSVFNQDFSLALPDSSGSIGFADAQHLASLLPGLITGVTYDTSDPNHPLLVYQAHLAQTFTPVNVPLNFSTQVGGLASLSSNSQLTITPQAQLDLAFGVDLSPLGANFQFSADPSQTPLRALNGGSGVTFNVAVTANNDLPFGPGEPATDVDSNGQLSSDLNLLLSINGTPYTVGVTQAQAATNTGIKDLVAELNASLSGVLASSSFAGGVSFRASGNALSIAASDPSVSTLSLTNATALGFAASQTSAADILISLHDGEEFSVSLKSAQTLGDVVNQIQAATAGKVTVSIDTANKRLQLSDSTIGANLFQVTALNDSLAGAPQLGLGLIGGEGTNPDGSGNGVILGAPLHGDSLANHLFVRDVSAAGSVSLSATNISATATLGLIGVSIRGGSASAEAHASVSLTDPGTVAADGRIELSELNDAISTVRITATQSLPLGPGQSSAAIAANGQLANDLLVQLTINGTNYSVPLSQAATAGDSSIDDLVDKLNVSLNSVLAATEFAGKIAFRASGNAVAIAASDSSISSLVVSGATMLGFNAAQTETLSTPQISGSATLNLSAYVSSALFSGLGTQTATTLSLNWSDITDPTTLILSSGGSGLAAQFQQLSSADVESAFGQIVSYLSQVLETSPLLTTKLPLLGKSVSNFLQTSVSLNDALRNLTLSPQATLETLVAALQTALGAAVTVSLDGSSLKFHLDFAPSSYSQELGVDVDIAHLLSLSGNSALTQLTGATSLIDSSGQANFSVQAGGNLNIDLGIDLTDPDNPRPFLYDSTQLSLYTKAAATNMNFNATLAGLVGLYVEDGSAAFSADGTVGGSPASFVLAVNDPSGRYYFDQTTPAQFTAVATGGVKATLPLYAPTASSPVGGSAADGNGDGVPDNAFAISIPSLQSALQGDPNSVAIITPDLGSLVPTSFSVSSTGGVLATGLGQLFDQLQSALGSKVFVNQLPIIGDQLTGAIHFFSDLADNAVGQLQSLINNAVSAGAQLTSSLLQSDLFQVLGPSGANVLGDRNGDSRVTADDITVTVDSSHMEFDLRLTQQADLGSNFNFQAGLASLGLGLQATGGVHLTAGYNADLDFGVDLGGVYLVSPESDIQLTAAASIPGLHAQGNLGPLVIQATDEGSLLQGTFDINFNDAEQSKLYLTDPATFTQNLQATFSGAADVDLNLGLGLDSSGLLPSISTDFVLHWGFGDSDTDSPESSFGSAPVISFNNVSLNVSDLVQSLTGGILKEVQSAIAPIEPVIDVITSDLPVLSSLGIHVSLEDVAQSLGLGDVVDFVNAVASLTHGIQTLSSIGGTGRYNLGSFQVSGADPRSADSMAEESAAVTQAPAQASATVADLKNDEQSISGLDFPVLDNPSSLFGLFLGQHPTLVTYTLPDLKLDLPFQLTVPVWVLPPVEARFVADVSADVHLSFGIDTLGIEEAVSGNSPLGPLGSIGEGLYISDSSGLTFSASVLAGVELDLIVLEFDLSGGIQGKVNFSLNDPNHDGKLRLPELATEGLANIFDTSGEVDAGLYAHLAIGLDTFIFGFITIWQETWTLAQVQLLDFNHNSSAVPPVLATESTAGLLTLNIGPRAGARQNGDLSDGDETFSVNPVSGMPGVVDVVGSVDGHSLGKQRYSGVTGVYADGGAGDDSITIGAGLAVPVTLRGGAGDDSLVGGSGPTLLDGGDGNDQLVAGSGVTTLYGGAGDDKLQGGDNQDVLIAGTGNDNLVAGNVGSLLWGGDAQLNVSNPNQTMLLGGNVQFTIAQFFAAGFASDGVTPLVLNGARVTGGPNDGKDNLQGGTGSDWLIGGAGQDYLNGEAGNDYLTAGNGGTSTLIGGDGNDTLFAGGNMNYLSGGQGIDRLTAIGGSNYLDGGAGNDFLIGGAGGGNTLVGGAGNDTLYATTTAFDGLGGNSLDGGAGDDILYGSGNDDTLTGGVGNDSIFGEGGSDTIYAGVTTSGGGSANDINLIYGDAPGLTLGGSDTIYGDIGADTIYGGSGANVIYGLGGDDFIAGGAGKDYLDGGSGNDTIYGGAGDDSLYGSSGNDVLIGGVGNDFLSAGSGNDLLWGGDAQFNGPGNSLLLGGNVQLNLTTFLLAGASADGVTPSLANGITINGLSSDGNDILYAGTGNDWLFGGGGADELHGGSGLDYLDAGAGVDVLYGGFGENILHGGADSDTLYGGQNASSALYGDAGDDFLYAGAAGNATQYGQVLYGGTGSDTLYAFAPSTDASAEHNLLGNVMYGGNSATDVASGDHDVLYGNLRSDILYGGGGNDLLYGDYLDGPNYLVNANPATIGSDDKLYGGAGDDSLYGGGGQDILWGGAGNDWLEGQDGIDTLYGGTGSDTLVLDVNFNYQFLGGETINGFGGNLTLGDIANDNATDILLVQGDQGASSQGVAPSYDDTIRFSEPVFGTLSVNYDGAPINVAWRDASGNPLFQQFKVLGLQGNDHVSFAQNADSGAIDFSKLIAHGDWVAWLDGGTGDDTLEGTPGADQIFGGPGRDTLYGYAGNDRLWGDAEAPTSSDGDDTLYGGAGNDDLIGGGGNNTFYAWSGDPATHGANDPAFTQLGFQPAQFAVLQGGSYVLATPPGTPVNVVLTADARFSLILTPNSPTASSATFNVLVPAVATQGDSSLADLITQVNAALTTAGLSGKVQAGTSNGQLTLSVSSFTYSSLQINVEDTGSDRMLGGAGADLMHAGNGLAFLFGNGGDDQYFNAAGQSFQQAGDADGGDAWKAFAETQEAVWYVPGTSADDQITVGYGPVLDQNGNQIGTPRNFVTRYEPANQTENVEFDLDYSNWSGALDPNALQGLLPPEGQFSAILIDAGAGADTVTIHNTVQKPVWVDGGAGNDTITVDKGNTQNNILFGGDGNDVIQGGSGSDWIFGGNGNDWLSGGEDGYASDLIYGGAGDDSLQLTPDFLPTPDGTASDFFDGGTGTNRLIYVGADLYSPDNVNNYGVPDVVAVRYRGDLQRYELTALVPTYVGNGQFAYLKDATGALEQKFAYIQTVNTQTFSIDTRSGNDSVFAGPIDANGDLVTINGEAWGINADARPQGATLTLDVSKRNGTVDSLLPGDSVFVGGAGDDVIQGGGGNDIIVGNGGNDTLSGGGGNDQFFGDTLPATVQITTPQQLPTVLDDGTHRAIDPPFAPSSLPPFLQQSIFTGVSIMQGALPTATIAQAFGLLGTSPGKQLSHFQDVGDLNGDGQDDYLASGAQKYFVLLGPVNLDDQTAVDQRAEPLGSIDTLGLPVAHMADVNGDGLSDLVFYKNTGTSLTLSTILGNADFGDPLHLPTTAQVYVSSPLPNVIATSVVNLFQTQAFGGVGPALVLNGSQGIQLYPANILLDGSTPTPLSFNSLSAESGYSGTAVGDINGDGAPDMVFVNSVSNTISVLDGLTGYLDSKDFIATGPISNSFALGDLNHDGYADFAVAMASSTGLAQILVFYGGKNPTLTPGLSIPVSANLTGGFAIDSSLSITAGDFNGDGKSDLAIGLNGATGVTSAAGSVYVLWSVADVGNSAALTDSNLVFQGTTSSDHLGTLPSTPDLDLNGDGVSDLVIGAAGYLNAGAIFAIYGARQTYPQDLANAQAVVFANSNQILTNSSVNGVPSLQATNAGPYQRSGSLAVGQNEDWYQFSTLGDGAAGNQIAISPAAQPAATTLMNVTSGVLQNPPAMYVTGSQGVLRFNGVTGEPWPSAGNTGAIFIPLGDSGMLYPDRAIVGPDGDLYVAEQDESGQPVILRYDAQTGAALPAPGQSGAVFVDTATIALPPNDSLDSFAFGPDGNLYLEYSVPEGSIVVGYLLRFSNSGQPLPALGQTDANVITPGSLGRLLAMAFAPNGDVYVSTLSEITRIDVTTGVVLGNLSSSVPLLARGMQFGSDGELYVANDGAHAIGATGTNGVIRFNVQSGASENFGGIAFPDDLIPQDLTFGPDGNLYVALFDSSANGDDLVAKFDGTTGQSLNGGAPFAGGTSELIFNANAVSFGNPQPTYQLAPSTTVTIGGSGQNLGVFELDLSSLLQFQNDTSDIQNIALKLNYANPNSNAPGATLQLYALDGEGDGVVNSLDATTAATLVTSFAFGADLAADGGVLGGAGGIDLTLLARQYIAAGKTRLTLRFATSTSQASVDVEPTATGGGNATIQPTSLITTVAGNGDYALNSPNNIAVDNAGNLFISDTYNNVVREVNHSTGAMSIVAGVGAPGFINGLSLDLPLGIVVDSAGDLYVADEFNNRVLKVNLATGDVTTVAGTGAPGASGDGGPAILATLNRPADLALDAEDNLFIDDYNNNIIREVNHASGLITTVAGNRVQGYNGDNIPATSAELLAPNGIAVDAAGNLFIADFANNRIREVDHVTGLITTVAGNGTAGFSGDGGAATSAELNFPTGLAIDADGNLVIADRNNNLIREVNSVTHLISTIAGAIPGDTSSLDDNVFATSANLNSPNCIALDAAGNLYITDAGNNRIREVAAGVAPSPTGLSVTTAVPGVLADLYDANGAKLATGQAVIDMRNLTAGTYYLRLYNPLAAQQTAPIDYDIAIQAPARGAFHPVTDNDLIYQTQTGNMVAGGAGLDQVIGANGTLQNYLVGANPTSVDPAVSIPDVHLQEALADAIGIPYTISSQHTPLLARPIVESDLVQLVSLNADGYGVSDLSGLQFATNLQSLDLANNRLTSLLLPAPAGIGQVALGQVLTQLRYLNLDNNQITDLSPLAMAGGASSPLGLTKLLGLSVDYNPIGDLSPLAGLTTLQSFSADGRPTALASNSGTQLQGLDENGNPIESDPYVTTLNQLTGDATTSQFNPGGTPNPGASPNFTLPSGSNYAVALQPDGRPVTFSAGGVFPATATNQVVSRFNADLSPDTSFGVSGLVTGPAIGSYATGPTAFQTDGKLIATASEPNFVTIYRYLPGGALDTTFGGGLGYVTIDTGDNPTITAVTVRPDGEILLLGYRLGNGQGNGGGDIFLMQLTTTGTLDLGFGGLGGWGTYTPFGTGGSVSIVTSDSIVLQPDGGFLVSVVGAAGNTQQLFEAKFNSDGTPDITFGQGNGFAPIAPRGGSGLILTATSSATDIVSGPNGTMILSYMSSRGVEIVRVNAAAEIDPSFGLVGYIRPFDSVGFDILFGTPFRMSNMIVAQDGSIYLSAAGPVFGQGNREYVVRITSAGAIDTTFGTNGFVNALAPLSGTTGTPFVSGHSLAEEPDGSIVVTSEIEYSKHNSYYLVVERFTSTGAIVGASTPVDFGESTAAIGGNILVGAPSETRSPLATDNSTDVVEGGVVSIYDQTGTLIQALQNPERLAGGSFGWAIAQVGNEIAVSAPGAYGGRVYLFDATSFAWLGTIADPTQTPGDEFGYSLAVSGNDLLIGSPGAADGGVYDSGLVYVFNASTLQQSRVPIQEPGAPAAGDAFGTSLAVSGGLLAIGAPGSGSAGAVDLYDDFQSAGADVSAQTIAAPAGAGSAAQFGVALALSGQQLVVGAPLATGRNIANAGAAYLYTLPYDANISPAAMAENFPSSGDRFGAAVAFQQTPDGNQILVGAPGSDLNSTLGAAGRVVIFKQTNREWDSLYNTQTAVANGHLGASITVAGSHVYVGARGDGISAAGTVAIYSRLGITDASPLGALTQLQNVSLANNHLSDVSAAGESGIAELGNLPLLQNLDLDDNQLGDITSLAGLPSLTNLSLLNNPLANPAFASPTGGPGLIAQLQSDGTTVSYQNDAAPIWPAAIGPQAMAAGGALTLTLGATDPNSGDQVFYTAIVTDLLGNLITDVNVEIEGDQLTLSAPLSFTGAVRVVVTAHDGPSAEGDWRGRTAQQSFELSVGSRAIYGNIFQDLSQTPAAMNLDQFTIYLDQNDDNSNDNDEPTITTTRSQWGVINPDGSYEFVNLPLSSSGVLRVQGPINWTQKGETSNVSYSINAASPPVLQGYNFVTWAIVDSLQDVTVPEGTHVSFSAGVHPPLGNHDTFSEQWVVTFNGHTVDSRSGASYDFTPTDAGSYIVTAFITESGANPASYSVQSIVTSTNVAPTVTLPADTHIHEGSQVSLNAQNYFSDPGSLTESYTYQWSVVTSNGQVIPQSSNPLFNFTAQQAGAYTVQLMVTDNHGGVGMGQFVITSDYVHPTTSAGGPYSIAAGSSLTLAGTAAAPTGVAAGDILSYDWDVNGDGIFGDATGTNPTLSWAQLQQLGITHGGATFQVLVQVHDADGGVTNSAPVTLTVTNTAPTGVSAGGPYAINQGSPLTLSAVALDPAGQTDLLSYSWDLNGDGQFGDATGQNPTLSWAQLNALGITHGLASFQVRVKASNPYGASTISTPTTLSVADVAPDNVSAGGPYTVNLGGSLVLSARTATDTAGVNDPLTYTWDVNGDGVFGDAVGQSPTLTWSQLNSLGIVQGGASLAVSVRISDAGGATTLSSPTTLSINNLLPSSVTAGGPYVISAGNPLSLSASATSPGGVSDPLAYAWDINGDGAFTDATGANPTLSWSQLNALGIAGPGTYNVSVQVTNGGGGALSSVSVRLTINSVLPISPTAGGPYHVTPGGSLSLHGSASLPPGVNDSLSYSWDINGDTVFGDAAGANPTLTWAQLVALGIGSGASNFNVSVQARDAAGSVTSAAVPLTVVLPPAAVAGVFVSGTDWNSSMLAAMQAAGKGNGAGYAIPVGSAAQLAALPWVNVNQIEIAFNEDVHVQENSLVLTGVTGTQYTFTNFAYDPLSFTATWTLSKPIGADRLTLALHSTGANAISNTLGGALDGDWTNSVTNYPSGNGAAGGDFNFALNVLPGDLTQDGRVDIQDLTLLANHWLRTDLLTEPTGDGRIDIQDLTLIANKWLTFLPSSGGGADLTGAVNASPVVAPTIFNSAPEPEGSTATTVSVLSMSDPIPLEGTTRSATELSIAAIDAPPSMAPPAASEPNPATAVADLQSKYVDSTNVLVASAPASSVIPPTVTIESVSDSEAAPAIIPIDSLFSAKPVDTIPQAIPTQSIDRVAELWSGVSRAFSAASVDSVMSQHASETEPDFRIWSLVETARTSDATSNRAAASTTRLGESFASSDDDLLDTLIKSQSRRSPGGRQ